MSKRVSNASFNGLLKLLILFFVVMALILALTETSQAVNDVASVGVSNNTATTLTAVYVEYNNLSIATGSGNTSVYISAVVSTNFTQAKLYGRVKRDGTVIESINFSQSVYPETSTFVIPVAETEATHIYTFEAYCTSGRLCTIWNRTFSAVFIKTGSYGTYNATYDATTSTVNGNLVNWNATYNSTYHSTTSTVNGNLANWNATYNATYHGKTTLNEVNSSAQITRSQVTGQTQTDDGQNTSISTNAANIGALQGVDASHNISITNLQVNDTYFNGTVFPQSTEFKNTTAVTANNTANLANTTANTAVQTSTYNGNFPNNTVAGNLVNWNATYNATYDSKEPAISQGVFPQFWMFNKTWQNITTTWITEGVNLWFTNARAISAVQAILDAMNASSAANNTASQSRDDILNNTKVNKSGDSLTGDFDLNSNNFTEVYDILDPTGKYYLKNNSVLPGDNVTVTQNANGTVSIASTGGTGSTTNTTITTWQNTSVGAQNFTLSTAFVTNSTRVYINGLRQLIGVSESYTENSPSVNFTWIVPTGAKVEVEYAEV